MLQFLINKFWNLWDLYYWGWFVPKGMPIVCIYLLFHSNPFSCMSASDSMGLESFANLAYRDFHYVIAGQKAVKKENGSYRFEQRYNYLENFNSQIIYSILHFPQSFCMGSIFKAIAYLNPDVRQRHREISYSLNKRRVHSNLKYYKKIGIDVGDYTKSERYVPRYKRRPGDEKHMHALQVALKEVVRILTGHKIPFWVDCGTCLGAYRYGGVIPWDFDVDIGILLTDHQNVKRALKALDPNRFVIQDWSSRGRPYTLLRVYVYSVRDYIDIYHFKIDPEKKQIQYVLSMEDNMFQTDEWRTRESRFTKPIAFDKVFPLKRGEFDGITVPMPNDTDFYLYDRYGVGYEKPAKVYNEISDQYEIDWSHPYWQRPYVH